MNQNEQLSLIATPCLGKKDKILKKCTHQSSEVQIETLKLI